MKTGSSIQNLEPSNVFPTKASLGRLMEYAKTGHFFPDSVVCTGDQLGECVYILLKGKCEHRLKSNEAGSKVLRSFGPGDMFGGMIDGLPDRLATEVVAIQDSIVLALRMEDVASVEAQNPTTTSSTQESEPGSSTTFFFNAPANQVDSLVFISDSVPAQRLSAGIAGKLLKETGERVLLLEFAAGMAVESCAYEHNLNGSGTLPGEIFRAESGFYRLRLKLAADPPEPGVVGEMLRKLRRRFRHVIISVLAEQIPAAYLFECVSRSNAAHFFLRPAADELYRTDLLLHELRNRLTNRPPIPLKSVVCLAADETIGDFEQQIMNIGVPPPMVIRDCPVVGENGDQSPGSAGTKLFQAGVRRMARDIGDCLVGLALSSGGAKGFAHIGVIQVLEENGLDVDVVAGASMGAYVGSIWCSGHDGVKLEELAREMQAKRAMWTLIDPVVLPWQGFLRGYAVKRRLQRSIGDARFADLARPLRIIATHLETMERKVFASGDVATAVHASIAVPGICVPVHIGEEIYIDGGIVDPVPTDVLRELGVRKIIAVNTIPTPERIRECLLAERELVRRRSAKCRSSRPRLLPSNRYMNHYGNSNVLEILMHSTHGAQMRVAEASSRQAALELHPDICDDRWLDFRNPGLYIQAGRDVALRHLEQLKTLIKEKGAPHELEPTPKTLASIVEK